jgi:TPR repeat protein
LKLSADQGNAAGQYHWGMCLLEGIIVTRDVAAAVQYLKLSAQNGNPEGRAIAGGMAEYGFEIPMDWIEAV